MDQRVQPIDSYILNHPFTGSTGYFQFPQRNCLHCEDRIWNYLQHWVFCKDCGSSVHVKCLAFLVKECNEIKKAARSSIVVISSHVMFRGHKMIERHFSLTADNCWACGGTIYGFGNRWYVCSGCGCHCHSRCFDGISKTCSVVQSGLVKHCNGNIRKIMGHEFQLQLSGRLGGNCEKCLKKIWGIFSSWFKCRDCGIQCHSHCIHLFLRLCPALYVTEGFPMELVLCVDTSLSQQSFLCAACAVDLSANKSSARFCNYTGKYYCHLCHWNDKSIIPGRVVQNWDFALREVCRSSYLYLQMMYKKPVINPVVISSFAIIIHDELQKLQTILSQIVLFCDNLDYCSRAFGKILQPLKKKDHLLNHPLLLSVEDLVELKSSSILTTVTAVYKDLIGHVKKNCATCKHSGSYCKACNKKEVIFTFEPGTAECPCCSSITHWHCLNSLKFECPGCCRKINAAKQPDK